MRLNHVRRGGGEPLLLLHPLGGELVVWEPVLDLLAREREVIAPDMPGFGASPPLAGGADPTPQALALAVAGFLDELGIQSAHLAGNSLGGWVALELAKLGRGRSVTALCAAGLWSRPIGGRPGLQTRTLARLLLPFLPALVATSRGRRLVLGRVAARPERVPRAAALRLARAYATAPAFERANAAMRSAVFSGVEDIGVPVTLAWADHDRLVRPPRHPPDGVRTVTLHGCGHLPTWDDPQQVTRVLLEGSDSARAAAERLASA